MINNTYDKRLHLKSDAYKWEFCYQQGKNKLPWIVNEVQPSLIEFVSKVKPKKVLEIGCGDGLSTNWLQLNGFDITAIDVSPTAIQMAKTKYPSVRNFLIADIFLFESVYHYDFIFDRGCIQCFDLVNIDKCSFKISQLLQQNGYWLSIIGKQDNKIEGPPKHKLSTISSVIENYFDIQSVESVDLLCQNNLKYPAWAIISKKT